MLTAPSCGAAAAPVSWWTPAAQKEKAKRDTAKKAAAKAAEDEAAAQKVLEELNTVRSSDFTILKEEKYAAGSTPQDHMAFFIRDPVSTHATSRCL